MKGFDILNKKLLSIGLILFLTISILTGCNNKSNESTKILTSDTVLTEIGSSIINNVIYKPLSIEEINGKTYLTGYIHNKSNITINNISYLYTLKDGENLGTIFTMLHSPLEKNSTEKFTTEITGDIKINKIEDLDNVFPTMNITIKDLDDKDIEMIYNYGDKEMYWTK